MSPQEAPILVTGAAGYLASWVVAQLLEEGCRVHATVRDLGDAAKLAHLHALAARHPGRLVLFEADLLQPGSFDRAMQGCATAIHVASPYFLDPPSDFERQLLAPARQGTLNLIGSIERTPTLRRLVLTASVVTLYNDARDLAGRAGHTVGEDDCNRNRAPRHNPYAYAKTAAEHAAREACQAQSRWDLVTVHPGAIFGPSLSRRADPTSVGMLVRFVGGAFRSGVPRLRLGVVDVRDAAAVHVGAALRPDAQGRYIAVARSMSLLEIARTLRPQDAGLPDRLPRRELPTWLVWLAAPLAGMTRGYVRGNVGHAIGFDNRRSQSELGVRYRDPAQTFGEHLAQAARDGLLAA